MRGGGLVEGGEAGFEEGGVGGVGVEVFLEEEVGDGSRFCPGMTGEGCAGEAFFYPAGEHVGIPCAETRGHGSRVVSKPAAHPSHDGEFVCFLTLCDEEECVFVPFVDEFGRGWHGVCYVVERRVDGEQAQNGVGCEDGELLLGEC